ncbi:MAG: GNAT family N-acetyltransferase [Myxococcales bacterium]|nr:GNAT family N-acetyltransferase [Myxococcales bacterium]
MHIRSVGLATDLELAATRGLITDRGGYLVVATPDDPDYYFGNMLVLPAPPQVGEVAYWSRKFAEELRDPAIRHVTLRWDGITGDTGATDELLAAGFKVETNAVLSARLLTAPHVPFEIRALAAREVPATAELEYADAERHDEAYRQFLLRRATWQQSLVASGKAAWFGAFDAGELVGALGLVALGNRARFQDVQTRATHRKLGIAAALLAAAAREVLPVIQELVIVAEAGGPAMRVYERVGFRPIERVASACRYPTAP